MGRVFQLKSTSRDSPRPSIEYLRTSGGMYHDTAVHDIDMLCWIVGEEPVTVFAQGSVFDPEIAGVGGCGHYCYNSQVPQWSPGRVGPQSTCLVWIRHEIRGIV